VHDFGSPDKTLLLEFRAEHHSETEDNHYGTLYQIPAQPGGPENILFKTNEPGTEGTAEYAGTFGKKGSFELGLDRSETQSHMDTLDLVTDPVTGIVTSNAQMTNKFYVDQTVSALYATAQDSWGRFGLSGGVRLEQAEVATNQITTAVTNDTRYGRLYPSAHLTYDLTDTQQLQLNYSHRVHRPGFEDLNPYPRYYDPYNFKMGNASLKPEEVHSIEAGYQYKQDETTYLATLYYRYAFNSFTTVSQYVNSTTLVTTEENLGESKSGGLELAATTSPLPKLNVNLSGDIFHNEIDASNLGYSGTKSALNWSGKLSTAYAWTKATSFQLDTNYTARRLTPQGYYAPRFVTNFGVKHEFQDRKFIMVLTISDIFNSLKEETVLNTPTLRDDSTRHRSARILSLGLIYNFGLTKKPKSEKLQFDNSM
jgi:outer membrane receptor protein involved in Fe transport